MCSNVGTENHQQELEAHSVYGILESMFTNEKLS